jgi:hypothetical protein
MIKSYPLNCFRPSTFVDIVGVPSMKNLRIDKVNDSGVYVYSHVDGSFMLSGASPAVITSDAPVDPALNFNSIQNIKERRARRSKIKSKVNDIKLPPGNKFTIKQVAELNEIPYVNAKKWIDENCFECGKAPKKKGVRGKSSNLYSPNQ